MTTNIENSLNNISPFIIRGLVLVGIVIASIGIVVACYKIVKRKKELRSTVYMILGGSITSLLGVITNAICSVDIEYSSFEWQIPTACIAGVVLAIIFCSRLDKCIVN